MVIMLILVVVILLLVSNSTGGYFGIMKEKLDVPTHTSECKIKCYKCCNYVNLDPSTPYPESCGTSADNNRFKTENCDCKC